MILYGLPFSSPCNKVRFLLHSLGIPYEFRAVNLFEGEGQQPEFLKLHPAGKIPVLDDDGFVIFESNAILRYLAAQAGSPLYPTQLRDRALIDQWMDLCSLYVGDGVVRVFFNRIIGPHLGRPVSEEFIADGLTTLARFLPVVEAQLAAEPYIAGTEMSIADYNLLAVLDPCEIGGIDLAPYLAISKWRNALRNQEFYTRCHRDYAAALALAFPAAK